MAPPTWKKTKSTGPSSGSRRSKLDRRSGEDRRKAYSLDYFINGGIERRIRGERRRNAERRADWRQVGKWYSVFCGDGMDGCKIR
ncbi:MAG: hypothetical protein AMJ54_14590 [Deltaproteobacteria bacterium SG8_13]|nr:MAG: hypothetical protein AMJ54_14590 [Deltaproteobacteria bacterium SG8_13]